MKMMVVVMTVVNYFDWMSWKKLTSVFVQWYTIFWNHFPSDHDNVHIFYSWINLYPGGKVYNCHFPWGKSAKIHTCLIWCLISWWRSLIRLDLKTILESFSHQRGSLPDNIYIWSGRYLWKQFRNQLSSKCILYNVHIWFGGCLWKTWLRQKLSWNQFSSERECKLYSVHIWFVGCPWKRTSLWSL